MTPVHGDEVLEEQEHAHSAVCPLPDPGLLLVSSLIDQGELPKTAGLEEHLVMEGIRGS